MAIKYPEVVIIAEKYPSLNLDYILSGVLIAQTDANTPQQVITQLEQDGFTFSGKQGHISYYHLAIRQTGQVNLYHQ